MYLIKKNLPLSISIAAISGALALTAMSDRALAIEPSSDNNPTIPSSQPTNTEDASIAKVTITAQNRTQQLQDVPISIQVVTSDQINKLAANNIADMNGFIPGLVIDASQPTQPNFSIRGIGTTDFGIGTDAPVGIYIDGVYAGKTGGALMNFNDVERVEVLKGPQGTLFGKNSAAGAISVITKEPSNDLENEANARISQYSGRYLDAMLNVPLSDTVALRFTMVDNKSNGWLKDSNTGQELNNNGDWGTRTSLRWNAPAQTKVIFSWEHESLNQNGRPEIGLIPVTLQLPAPQFPANPNTYLNPLSAPAYNNLADNIEKRKFDGLTIRIEHPFEWAAFNSTTAYRHFDSSNLIDNTGTTQLNSYLGTANIESNKTWQQEFKLSGKNDTVDWLTGVSLFSESATQTSRVITNTDSLDTIFNNLSGFPVFSALNGIAQQSGIPVNLLGNSWIESMNVSTSAKSYAIYGDVIWHVAPKFNLTTGIRYTYDSKNFDWYSPSRSAPGLDNALGTLNQVSFFPSLVQAGALTQAQVTQALAAMTQNFEYNNPLSSNSAYGLNKSWTDVSPRTVLDYKLTEDQLVFASIAKGYQSGGFNGQLTAGTYQPETVWNYELGLKSYFPDQHIVLNYSLFFYKFKNLQSISLVPNGSSIPQYLVTSSDQSAKGLDIDAKWQPTRDIRLFAVAEYIDQKFNNYTAADGINLNDKPVGTPLWSAAGGLDVTQRNVLNGKVNYSIQYAYVGPLRCNADSVNQGTCLMTSTIDFGKATNRTDGRISWDAANHQWGLAVFVTNLFNNRYVTGVDNTGLTTLGTPGAQISSPRIAGVQLHMSL